MYQQHIYIIHTQFAKALHGRAFDAVGIEIICGNFGGDKEVTPADTGIFNCLSNFLLIPVDLCRIDMPICAWNSWKRTVFRQWVSD